LARSDRRADPVAEDRERDAPDPLLDLIRAEPPETRAEILAHLHNDLPCRAISMPGMTTIRLGLPSDR
jgi:hypothetical protein